MTRLGGLNTNTGHGITKVGTGVMVAGTAVVADTSVTALSVIILTPQAGVVNIGTVWVSDRIVSTSFTVSSTNALDTRTVGYLIIEPL